MLQLAKNSPVTFFFSLACFTTWGCTGLHWLVLQGVLPKTPLFGYVAPFGPTIAGLITVVIRQGVRGVGDLIWRVRPWSAGWVWPLICLFLPVLLILLSLTVHVWSGAQISPPQWFSWPQFFYHALMSAFLGAGLTEEFGWRGFALPHLQAKQNALVSSLIIGIVWAIWHFPTIVLFGNATSMDLVVYTLSVTSMSVIMACIYNSTGGSLFAIMLFHGANNGAWKWVNNDLFPGLKLGDNAVANLATCGLWIATALLIVILFHPEDLSRANRQIVR